MSVRVDDPAYTAIQEFAAEAIQGKFKTFYAVGLAEDGLNARTVFFGGNIFRLEQLLYLALASLTEDKAKTAEEFHSRESDSVEEDHDSQPVKE